MGKWESYVKIFIVIILNSGIYIVFFVLFFVLFKVFIMSIYGIWKKFLNV